MALLEIRPARADSVVASSWLASIARKAAICRMLGMFFSLNLLRLTAAGSIWVKKLRDLPWTSDGGGGGGVGSAARGAWRAGLSRSARVGPLAGDTAGPMICWTA